MMDGWLIEHVEGKAISCRSVKGGEDAFMPGFSVIMLLFYIIELRRGFCFEPKP